MNRLIVGRPEAMSKEPCLEHPDSLPLPKPKKSWKDMEIPPELRALHEENMRRFFSKKEK